MVQVLGLTGSIATGKSTVSQYLRKLGFPVVDADLISREVVKPGMIATQKLRQTFGDQVFDNNDELNRKKLGQLVFSDSENMKKLNEIMQPAIKTEIIRQIEKLKKSSKKLIVLDAPLLLEQNYQFLVDQVMVVVSSPTVQLQRLRQRDGLSMKEAQARISSQWSQKKKRLMADVVIDNSTSIEETHRQVLKWLDNSKLR
ncbi:dephospho-CoA kinase [Pediococcus ethanolidurans]|uniref:dephospho-CoA kinase n=1 Tax=Pediococcus ethanolidurans TaxID=319653 RepID=UPI001C1EC060|nr:dephospho-CoA kinase [Pediococcus ethanolidurans]MBU7554795.1 dephospho-CoA kinase [Pediococcus ethanolidurans]MBU7562725.1 dephospho-CoA kinase [Pediococcus ethanolidurans]MCT4397511.1 dephospho-CoA kinase [Pediococcus ethanolidurans]MCV3314391.1 dephospho-CoA kinase [Pediococcus ethanolidurans]MCV3320644.1 dephospho-CoA kinase [Pediococcus ethanolidurans]